MHQEKVVSTTETVERHEYIVEYVPYIQYKNGEILLYEKKEKNSQSTGSTTVDIDINSSTNTMKTIAETNTINNKGT